MDIVLVQTPFITRKESSPYHGPAIIAGVVKNAEFTFKIIDWNLEYWAFKNKNEEEFIEKWVQDIEKIKPKFVGVSIFECMEQRKLELLEKIFKKINSKVILGGPWVSISNQPKKWLEQGIIDYFIKGDGEEGIVALLNNQKHESINNDIPYHIKDLNNIPEPIYDFNKIKMKIYTNKTFIVESSRGCIKKCNFCPNFYKGAKLKSPKSVAKEFQNITQKYHPDTFILSDSMFNVSPTHVRNVTKELIKINNQISWMCHWTLRSKKLFPEDIYNLLEKAKCERILVGIESGSERIRKEMNKDFISEDNLFFLVEQTDKHNIVFHCNIIIGYYKETVEDFQMTLDLLKRISVKSKSCLIKFAIFHLQDEFNTQEMQIKFDKYGEWCYNNNNYITRMERIYQVCLFCLENGIEFYSPSLIRYINVLYKYSSINGVPELIENIKNIMKNLRTN